MSENVPPVEPQDEYARIGGVLRAARESLGYTQLRMAGEIGVSEGTYSRYEAGKQKITIPELKHAAALLGVPLEDVLRGGPSGPALVPDLADRIADRVTERVTERVFGDMAGTIGTIVRAILAEQGGRAGQRGGSPVREGTGNTDENDEARRSGRPGWRPPVSLAAAG